MSQVVLEARALPAESLAAGEGQSGSTQDAPQTPRGFVTAWLLLLLERQVTHGYELHRQLEAHGVPTEVGAMYRTLRKLEQEGWATSTWTNSTIGPRRRQYQLTTKGRRELHERVAHVTCARDVHAAFLQAYEGSALVARGAVI